METIDQADIRGSKPHNHDPSGTAYDYYRESGQRPVANFWPRILLRACSGCGWPCPRVELPGSSFCFSYLEVKLGYKPLLAGGLLMASLDAVAVVTMIGRPDLSTQAILGMLFIQLSESSESLRPLFNSLFDSFKCAESSPFLM